MSRWAAIEASSNPIEAKEPRVRVHSDGARGEDAGRCQPPLVDESGVLAQAVGGVGLALRVDALERLRAN
eukprot:14208851-Alexandrium_andersonii.AAC.1